MTPSGDCASPVKAACSSRGDAKTAYLEGPVQCGNQGWFCRILPDANYGPGNLMNDLNFHHCNATTAEMQAGTNWGGHCHGSDADDTYYWCVLLH